MRKPALTNFRLTGKALIPFIAVVSIMGTGCSEVIPMPESPTSEITEGTASSATGMSSTKSDITAPDTTGTTAEGSAVSTAGLDSESEEAVIGFLSLWDSNFTEQSIKKGIAADITMADATTKGTGTLYIKDKEFSFDISTDDSADRRSSKINLYSDSKNLYLAAQSMILPPQEGLDLAIPGFNHKFVVPVEEGDFSFTSSERINEFIDSIQSAKHTMLYTNCINDPHREMYEFIFKQPDMQTIISDTPMESDTPITQTSQQTLRVLVQNGRILSLVYEDKLGEQTNSSLTIQFKDMKTVTVPKPDTKQYIPICPKTSFGFDNGSDMLKGGLSFAN